MTTPKVGLDDYLIDHTAEEFWNLPEYPPGSWSQPTAFSESDWPDPSPLGDELPAVEELDLELLPSSFRAHVEDVADRMQVPPEFPASAAIVALAGCVNRRAVIRPKVEDTWEVIPNLWGALVAPPGWMKSPAVREVTVPLLHIEESWRVQHAQRERQFIRHAEESKLQLQAWREQYRQAARNRTDLPARPEDSPTEPVWRRLLLTDSTFEKLHEVLRDNSSGILVLRDELTGWLAQLDRPGREDERAFYLQAWNGDCGFTIDRIGRGSVHVPAVCVSLFGNIQPARLRWYLSQAADGGPGDDGLFQRFQILVWPDTPVVFRLTDRLPNASAQATVERVFSCLANLSADNPVRLRFDCDAQHLFLSWLTQLEHRLRGERVLPAVMITHLAKYRSLMPTLAGLFEMADAAARCEMGDQIAITLDHARQAAALCDWLESHAQRVYSCVVSPECRAARELGRRIQTGELKSGFTTRSIYLKGWTGLNERDRVRGALALLDDAGWVCRAEPARSPAGGRPAESWLINPKVVTSEK